MAQNTKMYFRKIAAIQTLTPLTAVEVATFTLGTLRDFGFCSAKVRMVFSSNPLTRLYISCEYKVCSCEGIEPKTLNSC